MSSKVNFSSTEAESSDAETSDRSDQPKASNGSNVTQTTESKKTQSWTKKHKWPSTISTEIQKEVNDIQVFNLSAKAFTEAQISLLSKGLSCSPTFHFDLYYTILDSNKGGAIVLLDRELYRYENLK